jgi:ribonuclease HII
VSPSPGSRSRVPTLRHERRLLRAGHVLVAGVDEVGRGALAGPVSVGVVAIDASVRTAPSGIRDSKLLTPAARTALVPRLRRWAVSWAVGHAEPEEIDRYGIIAALRLAARRALATLPDVPTCVLLDGSHDWLSPPRPRRPSNLTPPDGDTLFDLPAEALVAAPLTSVAPLREAPPEVPLPAEPQVLTMVKADLRCAAVAAASVLAKVERDAIMVARSAWFPRYSWQENKGYSAPDHLSALATDGPCEQHRRSWSLPGVNAELLIDLTDLPEALDIASDLTDADDLADGVLVGGDLDEGSDGEVLDGEGSDGEVLDGEGSDGEVLAGERSDGEGSDGEGPDGGRRLEVGPSVDAGR